MERPSGGLLPKVAGDRMYVSFGPSGPNNDARFWVSDGSSAGTTPVGAYAGVLRGRIDGAGDPFLFAGSDEATGVELWIHDAGGARMLLDLAPAAASSSPHHFVETPHGVLFIARDRLHRSDGTVEGTVALTAWSATQLAYLGELGGRSIIGWDAIYETDGTPAGTVRIADTAASSGAQLEDAVLVAEPTNSWSIALWVIDANGVRMLVEHLPTTSVVVSNGRASFFGWGRSLWRSDSTLAATGIVLADDRAVISCGRRLYESGGRLTAPTCWSKAESRRGPLSSARASSSDARSAASRAVDARCRRIDRAGQRDCARAHDRDGRVRRSPAARRERAG